MQYEHRLCGVSVLRHQSAFPAAFSLDISKKISNNTAAIDYSADFYFEFQFAITSVPNFMWSVDFYHEFEAFAIGLA